MSLTAAGPYFLVPRTVQAVNAGFRASYIAKSVTSLTKKIQRRLYSL